MTRPPTSYAAYMDRHMARREPRIFMLGTPSREESLEDYERRNGEPLDPAWETKATEIAPGVRVLVLSTSGHPFGARVAVWHDPQGSDDD